MNRAEELSPSKRMGTALLIGKMLEFFILKFGCGMPKRIWVIGTKIDPVASDFRRKVSMSEYESCASCSSVIRITDRQAFERCEQCNSPICLSCAPLGCPVCKTERDILLKTPSRPKILQEQEPQKG